LEKCLPYARDAETEKYEILDALLVTASSPGKIITTQTLRRWYEKFGGDLKIFDAEIQL
jgi:hypothetical protein